MSRNVFNPAVSSIECLVLIRNDAGEIKENQDHWLRLHYVCAHACMCLCIHVCVFLCACIFMFGCICICVCLYLCVYIM